MDFSKLITKFGEADTDFLSVKQEPFRIYGAYSANDGDVIRRMPEETAKKVSDRVHMFHAHATGVRVRFCTDSPYVIFAIEQKCEVAYPMFMSAHGFAGTDMYVNGEYVAAFVPQCEEETKNGYNGIYRFYGKGKYQVQLNLPLYCQVKDVYIGVKKGSVITAGEEYPNKKPVVFYGSSIVHGGNVSSASACYPTVVSRLLNCDFINLGFSGSAFGEKEMAEYISGLSMAAFIFDYDHNAPTVEHLKNTHKPFFDIVREKNPSLPIIFINRPFCADACERAARTAVIKETYETALKNGDKNVRFIDNEETFSTWGQFSLTNDGTHPNDLGMALIAKRVCESLKEFMPL